MISSCLPDQQSVQYSIRMCWNPDVSPDCLLLPTFCLLTLHPVYTKHPIVWYSAAHRFLESAASSAFYVAGWQSWPEQRCKSLQHLPHCTSWFAESCCLPNGSWSPRLSISWYNTRPYCIECVLSQLMYGFLGWCCQLRKVFEVPLQVMAPQAHMVSLHHYLLCMLVMLTTWDSKNPLKTVHRQFLRKACSSVSSLRHLPAASAVWKEQIPPGIIPIAFWVWLAG